MSQGLLRDFALLFSFLLFEVFIDLVVCALLRIPIAFLDFPNELVPVSLYVLPIVVSQIRPLLFKAANHLLPFAFNYITVHISVLPIRLKL